MIKKVSYRELISIVGSLSFKEKDEMEAREFNCKNVIDCYFNIKMPEFSECYIVYDNRTNDVLCPIVLQRDGFLIFFVTKNLGRTNQIQFVKDIKKLSQDVVNRVGSIFVNTINWYKEAHKIDELIGFRPYKRNYKFTTYVLENK